MSKKSDTIWKYYFGDALQARDAFGVTIFKKNYVQNVKFAKKGSWTLDYIFPKDPHNDTSEKKRQGSNSLYNIQPLSARSSEEKGQFLAGKVNGITFSIKIIEQYQDFVIGKMMIKINDTWYWAYN